MLFGLFGGEKKRVAEMIAAARTGNIEKVKQLLSKGVDINAPEPESGETPLLAAIDKSQCAAAEFLLQQRPNLNLEDKNGNTPLYLAVSRGDEALALVNLLLDAGAQVDLGPMKGDNAGVTPLHIACATGANGCLETLLRRGASATKQIPSGATPLHTAAIGGDKKTIDLLCKAGGNVTALNADKRTPLHNCGITGNAKAAAALIQQGAAVDGADAEGCTPLMRAVMKNQAEVAKVLLSNGANPDIIVRNTDTPLYPLFVAAMNGYTDLVRVLIDKGANVMAKVEGVLAPLDAAKHNGHEAAAKLLSAAIKRQRAAAAAAKVGDPDEIKKSAAKSTKSSATTAVTLGVYCTDLRYDEEEHGAHLPAAFKKAQAEWIKSKNDVSTAHYAEACRLLDKWFESKYQVRMGLSFSMSIDQDNLPDEVQGVQFKDSSEASAYAFAKEPKLKSLKVVAVDFRGSTSSKALRDDEKLKRSPELGIVAIFEAKIGKDVKTPEALADLLKQEHNGQLIKDCFSIQIVEKAIQTVEVDDDGDEVVSSNSSWSGGGLSIEINLGMPSDDFPGHLLKMVQEERQSPSLLAADASPIKKLIMLGDEGALEQKLNEGLDPNERIDDEPLLKMILMVAVTAKQWYADEEFSGQLSASFSTIEKYEEALKRMALDILRRGANINSPSGMLSILSVAEALNDEEILNHCRAGAETANDLNSTPFLLAAERGDAAALKVLLGKGARINKREFFHSTTPLMMACQGPGGEDEPWLAGAQLIAQEVAVRFLIEQGAEIDAVSDNGNTAIGNAVRRGNASIVRILLDSGAKATEALPRGQSLLELAKARGHADIVDILDKIGKK